MNKLVLVSKPDDVFPEYQNTPIGKLLEYHNFKRAFESYENAQLLIGMCMDNRKYIRLPENFAYIIRTGGANLRYNEFKVSYAIAIGGVRHIALIAHNNCGMVNLADRKTEFIDGLVNFAGWDKKKADEHFIKYEPRFEIGNEMDFIIEEVKNLRKKYPKIIIAPLMYLIEDNSLYLIDEK